jgi:hypothetical protein
MQTEAPWYARWFSDPGFKADVVTQWNALKNNGVFTAWLASIQQESATLEQSQANNFGRWPMLGMEVWPNPEAAGSYDGEVSYLISWLTLRIAYLDSLFNAKTQTSTTLSALTGSLPAGSPVTLTAQVTGGTNPTGVVTFLSGGVFLGSAPLSGGAASLTVASLQLGTDSLQAVYSGDNGNALSVSTAQSLTVAPAPASTVTSIAAPLATGASSRYFTASVIANSGSAVPTGTIRFSIDQHADGGTVPLNAAGQASWLANRIDSGAHMIVATYSGDPNCASSSSNAITFQATPSPAVSIQ